MHTASRVNKQCMSPEILLSNSPSLLGGNVCHPQDALIVNHGLCSPQLVHLALGDVGTALLQGQLCILQNQCICMLCIVSYADSEVNRAREMKWNRLECNGMGLYGMEQSEVEPNGMESPG